LQIIWRKSLCAIWRDTWPQANQVNLRDDAPELDYAIFPAKASAK
jgi:hypothetical protein